MSPFCAILFFVQMIAFACAAAFASAQHSDAVPLGVGLALLNFVGFVTAAHAWLAPREDSR